ncbi:GCN5 family acetyltransferase [Aeromonas veronii]|uniref:acetyltransferase n=1 Tax=Aeromonas veronii TaxID=654 RepID=UPI0007186C36|nr:acetyltransferase [Aeromonas veronii]KRV65981.1 GCN5 family acetyltransferase [Aeromonas veronii]KRV76874.1 GCN5 family acetyltransferase [Aeromonas veronii]KRV86904.1 GCN5 family acetyltransferase [Aeromonas veronii]KRV87662.1 GCN5 family acetyltransferase [Aeromonas veronii]
MKIDTATRADYPALIDLWEASVRASHHFLPEAEILALKPLILEHYFDAVTLHSVRTKEGQITGFSGVYEGKLEMLFVAPEARGSGVGRLLVAHAISQCGATQVDVNEQNEQAVGFYLKMGFTVTGRSPLDGQGKPYPLLHMALAPA